jgi:hypothetical protein
MLNNVVLGRKVAPRCIELLLRAWDCEGLSLDMRKEALVVDFEDAKADRDVRGLCDNLRLFREHRLSWKIR